LAATIARRTSRFISPRDKRRSAVVKIADRRFRKWNASIIRSGTTHCAKTSCQDELLDQRELAGSRGAMKAPLKPKAIVSRLIRSRELA